MGNLPSREMSRECRARGRVSSPRVGPRIHLPANDAGESVENDHKSLTSGSFCLHAVSVPFFLSSTPARTGRMSFPSRSRLRGDDLFAVAIKDTASRHTIRSINALTLSFLSILYCHDNARLRLIVRSSVPHKEGTINRGDVKSFLSRYRVFFLY